MQAATALVPRTTTDQMVGLPVLVNVETTLGLDGVAMPTSTSAPFDPPARTYLSSIEMAVMPGRPVLAEPRRDGEAGLVMS